MTVPMWPADLCVATYTIGKGMGLELFADGRVFPAGRGEASSRSCAGCATCPTRTP